MALPKSLLLLLLLVASSAADSLPTCIVGGGLGGVAVADYIKTNADTPVIIFEKEARLGGKIRTSYAGS